MAKMCYVCLCTRAQQMSTPFMASAPNGQPRIILDRMQVDAYGRAAFLHCLMDI